MTTHACIPRAVTIVDERGRAAGLKLGAVNQDYRAILIGLDLRLDELDDFGTEIARLAISDASRIVERGAGDNDVVGLFAAAFRYATIVGAIAVADTREAHE